MLFIRLDEHRPEEMKLAVMLINHYFSETNADGQELGDYGLAPWGVSTLKQTNPSSKRIGKAPVVVFVAYKIRGPHFDAIKRLDALMPTGPSGLDMPQRGLHSYTKSLKPLSDAARNGRMIGCTQQWSL